MDLFWIWLINSDYRKTERKKTCNNAKNRINTSRRNVYKFLFDATYLQFFFFVLFFLANTFLHWKYFNFLWISKRTRKIVSIFYKKKISIVIFCVHFSHSDFMSHIYYQVLIWGAENKYSSWYLQSEERNVKKNYFFYVSQFLFYCL